MPYTEVFHFNITGDNPRFCLFCGDGRSANHIGESDCKECAPQKIANQSNPCCNACPNEKVPNAEQSDCIPCPGRKVPSPGGDKCVYPPTPTPTASSVTSSPTSTISLTRTPSSSGSPSISGTPQSGVSSNPTARGLATKIIVGISVGAASGVLILGAVVNWFYRSRRATEENAYIEL